MRMYNIIYIYIRYISVCVCLCLLGLLDEDDDDDDDDDDDPSNNIQKFSDIPKTPPTTNDRGWRTKRHPWNWLRQGTVHRWKAHLILPERLQNLQMGGEDDWICSHHYHHFLIVSE